MQIISNTSDNSPCEKCGANLADLGSFTYRGKTENTPVSREETCQCRKCGELFIIRYDFFDSDGHIQPYVFNGDVNDLTYNWQDQLTKEQRKAIGSHLKACKTCNDKLAEEALSDAWLASMLHNGNQPNEPPKA